MYAMRNNGPVNFLGVVSQIKLSFSVVANERVDSLKVLNGRLTGKVIQVKTPESADIWSLKLK